MLFIETISRRMLLSVVLVALITRPSTVQACFGGGGGGGGCCNEGASCGPSMPACGGEGLGGLGGGGPIGGGYRTGGGGYGGSFAAPALPQAAPVGAGIGAGLYSGGGRYLSGGGGAGAYQGGGIGGASYQGGGGAGSYQGGGGGEGASYQGGGGGAGRTQYLGGGGGGGAAGPYQGGGGGAGGGAGLYQGGGGEASQGGISGPIPAPAPAPPANIGEPPLPPPAPVESGYNENPVEAVRTLPETAPAPIPAPAPVQTSVPVSQSGGNDGQQQPVDSAYEEIVSDHEVVQNVRGETDASSGTFSQGNQAAVSSGNYPDQQVQTSSEAQVPLAVEQSQTYQQQSGIDQLSSVSQVVPSASVQVQQPSNQAVEPATSIQVQQPAEVIAPVQPYSKPETTGLAQAGYDGIAEQQDLVETESAAASSQTQLASNGGQELTSNSNNLASLVVPDTNEIVDTGENVGSSCNDPQLRAIVQSALDEEDDNLKAAQRIETEAAKRFGGRFNSVVSGHEFAYVNWYDKRNCQLRRQNRHSLTWED